MSVGPGRLLHLDLGPHFSPRGLPGVPELTDLRHAGAMATGRVWRSRSLDLALVMLGVVSLVLAFVVVALTVDSGNGPLWALLLVHAVAVEYLVVGLLGLASTSSQPARPDHRRGRDRHPAVGVRQRRHAVARRGGHRVRDPPARHDRPPAPGVPLGSAADSLVRGHRRRARMWCASSCRRRSTCSPRTGRSRATRWRSRIVPTWSGSGRRCSRCAAPSSWWPRPSSSSVGYVRPPRDSAESWRPSTHTASSRFSAYPSAASCAAP